uniref:Uncharacterized protein n=1 Tax=Romanomermis culicivorax TaxID=13658 RepID=A0A915JT89_ROMCU
MPSINNFESKSEAVKLRCECNVTLGEGDVAIKGASSRSYPGASKYEFDGTNSVFMLAGVGVPIAPEYGRRRRLQ